MKCSLIITTYNNTQFLNLCLESVMRQSRLPDEIIVADDGSDGATAALVADYRRRCPVPLRHVWQRDSGYRLARSRNNALAVAQGEYIIGIDGDLVLERHFVEDHLRLARRGYYLKGGRCKLGVGLTRRLCERGSASGPGIFARGIERKRLNLLRLPGVADYLAPRYRRGKPGVLGCNQSFFLADAVAVNGYDESYEGWGGEDTDFIRRLRKHGLGVRHLKFGGCAAHLWHRERADENAKGNLDRSRRDEHELETRCAVGLDRAVAAMGDIDLSAPVIVFPG